MMNLRQSNPDISLKSDPVAVAKKFSLEYTNPGTPCFKRVKAGQGFKFLDTKNQTIKDKKHIQRIKGLVIPPAWKDVWICPNPKGHIQVVGKDVRGRKQYRYHPTWTQRRNEKKFEKMLVFAKKLPLIRKTIQSHLKEKKFSAQKVVASVVKIMEQTLIRIGNEEYAEQNNSYGLTTIRNHHVKVKGKKIVFDFKGKSGKFHHVEIQDAQLADIVRKCKDLPGHELFCYQADDGTVKDVTSFDVNQYLQTITGESITAKDFRTWGGTVQAALFLKDLSPPPSERELKSLMVKAVAHTSTALRNTPNICKKYYIHPTVFAKFENGQLHKVYASCKKTFRKSVRDYFFESFIS